MKTDNGKIKGFNSNSAVLNAFRPSDRLRTVGDVFLLDIKINDNNTYTATLRIRLMDDFGLDERDVINAPGGKKGFRPWWVLQHQRGYQPFRTILNFNMQIDGSF